MNALGSSADAALGERPLSLELSDPSQKLGGRLVGVAFGLRGDQHAPHALQRGPRPRRQCESLVEGACSVIIEVASRASSPCTRHLIVRGHRIARYLSPKLRVRERCHGCPSTADVNDFVNLYKDVSSFTAYGDKSAVYLREPSKRTLCGQHFCHEGSGMKNSLDESHAPEPWCGSSGLIDLADPRLLKLAKKLVFGRQGDRERALAIYRYVREIPLYVERRWRPRAIGKIVEQRKGDVWDKTTMFVSLLRAAGVPSRVVFALPWPEALQGLPVDICCGARPVVEAFIANKWSRTDTYIFDYKYLMAARASAEEAAGIWLWDRGFRCDGLGWLARQFRLGCRPRRSLR